MSKAIAFFPWLGSIESARSLGPIRLLPYTANLAPGDQLHATQADIDGVLRAYANTPKRRVKSATLIEVDDWRLGQDPEPAVARLFAAREAMAFAALADRKLFQGHFGYCNYDHFNLVVQRFEAGRADRFAFTTRRRDGGAGHLWTSEEFAFNRPLHLNKIDRVDFDEQLATLLMDDVPSHWLDAVADFNRANTDSADVLPHVELIMMKSAFEWLLEVDESAVAFERALVSCLASTETLGSPDGPLKDLWTAARPKAGRPLLAWAREFCARRGAAAHGAARDAKKWVWSEASHLAFASILFPLILKKVAAEAGLWEMSFRDCERLRRLDNYVVSDPMAPSGPDERGNEDVHPWRLIESQIGVAELGRQIRQQFV